MSGLPAVEDIYEMDDGYTVGWMGLHIMAHVDDETAVALAWSHMEYEGREGSLTPPRRTYLRKVPCRYGGMRYHYSGRGRGATPVTLMEQPSGWAYWCDVPGCRWQFVRGSAKCGVPRVNISNGPELGVQPQYRPGEYVYLCRWHHQRYDENLRAARAEAMRAYYAERAAS